MAPAVNRKLQTDIDRHACMHACIMRTATLGNCRLSRLNLATDTACGCCERYLSTGMPHMGSANGGWRELPSCSASV